MRTLSIDPGPDMAQQLANHLDQFLVRSPGAPRERRDSQRLAIPMLLRVAPRGGRVGPDHDASCSTAVGKDLSGGGIGFFHREPLPHRHVIITFDDPRLAALSVEVELNRCRFSNLGWYESGGRLLRIVDPGHRAPLAG